LGTDAFQLTWLGLQGYAFLPFSLISRCVQKIWQSGADNSPLAGTGLVFSSSGASSGEASVTTNETGHPSRSTQSAIINSEESMNSDPSMNQSSDSSISIP